MTDLFQCLDYRTYLKDWIGAQPKKGHGLISALAHSARCQPAYFSRVLLGKAQLSPEQAFAIQTVLGHSADQIHYFMLLLEWERAGDPGLKAFRRAKIETARQARTDLRNRFKEASTLTREHQVTYYSSAHYAAIHACISVPEIQTIARLESFLKVSRERIAEILGFLQVTGLAIEEKGRWKVGQNRLHLNRDSDLIRNHHSNWRVEAIKSLDRGKGAQGSEDLHYSAVVSLSREDAIQLKEHWIQALERFGQVVTPSHEETVRAITLDFFALD